MAPAGARSNDRACLLVIADSPIDSDGAIGDSAAARLVLLPAAKADNAEAALALASTCDPFVLRNLAVHGFSADAEMARAWYEKAREFGSAEAPQRLDVLANGAR